jgi:BMFP domain-containing protein YqiC
MFLSAQEIAHSREHALNNLLALSSNCFQASQRLNELLSAASRDALHHGSRHFAQFGHGQLDVLTQLPANLWLEQSIRSSKLFDSACEILGETHKAMIQSTEAQVRVIDEIVFASINRVAKTSPWEGEIALNAMRTTLEGAENTLHSVTEAALDGVDLVQRESHEMTAPLVEAKPARKRPAARSRKPAQ